LLWKKSISFFNLIINWFLVQQVEEIEEVDAPAEVEEAAGAEDIEEGGDDDEDEDDSFL